MFNILGHIFVTTGDFVLFGLLLICLILCAAFVHYTIEELIAANTYEAESDQFFDQIEEYRSDFSSIRDQK